MTGKAASDAWKRRQVAKGHCPHCGKPCAPYYECEERRFYKRVVYNLRRLEKFGVIKKTPKGWIHTGLDVDIAVNKSGGENDFRHEPAFSVDEWLNQDREFYGRKYHKPWPEEKHKKLEHLYFSGMAIKDIAAEFQTTETAILQRLYRYKLKRPPKIGGNRGRWSKREEDDLLMLVEFGTPVLSIMEKLGRTEHSIRARLSSLVLDKHSATRCIKCNRPFISTLASNKVCLFCYAFRDPYEKAGRKSPG